MVSVVELHLSGLINVLVGLITAPLLFGVINRTKAVFAGRRGEPLLQPYYDLRRLLGKGAVYSRTATWVLVTGPIVGVAAMITATAMMPLGGQPAFLTFSGDLLLFAYLLGLMRFFTILAALDTGSSFEGMGASREATFSALAEPTLFLALGILAHSTGQLSLTGIFRNVTPDLWLKAGPVLAMLGVALFTVFLAENSRIPVDDPNTHLELTMIHEVMVLDHSGPDFFLVLYGAALKMWVLGTLLVGIFIPVGAPWWGSVPAALGGMILLAVITGIVESIMARLRLNRIPQMLVGSTVLAALALIMVLR